MTKIEPRSAETLSMATVLVVDDIAANRDLLRATLEPQGYELLLAANGEQALKVAQRAAPCFLGAVRGWIKGEVPELARTQSR